MIHLPVPEQVSIHFHPYAKHVEVNLMKRRKKEDFRRSSSEQNNGLARRKESTMSRIQMMMILFTKQILTHLVWRTRAM